MHPDSKSLLGLEYRENVVLVPFIAIVEKGPDVLHTAIDGRGIYPANIQHEHAHVSKFVFRPNDTFDKSHERQNEANNIFPAERSKE